MVQKKLNPKFGIQPKFICPKIDNRHQRQIFGEILPFCLPENILWENHREERRNYHGSLPSSPYLPSFAS